jgi:hypothetical protein
MKKTNIKKTKINNLIQRNTTSLRSHLLNHPSSLLEFKRFASSLQKAYENKVLNLKQANDLLAQINSKSSSLLFKQSPEKLSNVFISANKQLSSISTKKKIDKVEDKKPSFKVIKNIERKPPISLKGKILNISVPEDRKLLLSNIKSSNFKSDKKVFLKVYDSFPSIRERYNVILNHLQGNKLYVKQHVPNYNAFVRDVVHASKSMKSKNPVDIIFSLNFELFSQAESFLNKDYSNIPSSRMKFFIEHLK